jgi:hypothetical protein
VVDVRVVESTDGVAGLFGGSLTGKVGRREQGQGQVEGLLGFVALVRRLADQQQDQPHAAQEEEVSSPRHEHSMDGTLLHPANAGALATGSVQVGTEPPRV